jgi:hypothetical protein
LTIIFNSLLPRKIQFSLVLTDGIGSILTPNEEPEREFITASVQSKLFRIWAAVRLAEFFCDKEGL